MNMDSVKKHGWLLVAALMMFGMGGASLSDYHKALEVPQALIPAEGRLITAACELSRNASFGGRSGSLIARPVVQYAYDYQGSRHVSDRYGRSRKIWMGVGECDAYLEHLRASGPLRIWIDPNKPSVAALNDDLNPPWMEYLFLAIGGIFALVGVYKLSRRWA